MVEYALLLTMVAIPMIVITTTMSSAVGEVWQVIIDDLEDTSMFAISDYTLMESVTATEESTESTPTNTPTMTGTYDPAAPDTETPTATDIPTETEIPSDTPTKTPFIPATMTFTPSDAPTATDVPTNTLIPTNIPSVTPVLLAVDSATVTRKRRAIVANISVNKTVDLSVKDTLGNITKYVTCISTCKVRFDPLDGGGFIEIKSDFGDSLNISYPPAN